MNKKKFLSCIVALLLLFAYVQPIYAAVDLETGEFFTTDASEEDVKRVAFFIEEDLMPGYYREVEGYIFPEGTTLSMNSDLFNNRRFYEREYYNDVTRGVIMEPVYCYAGFGSAESNSIQVNNDYLLEVISTNGYNRTEWLFYASDKMPSTFYRELEEGEVVDSRLRPLGDADKIKIFDDAGRAYECECDADIIKPVTFTIEKEGNVAEVDGFVIGEDFSHFSGTAGNTSGLALNPFSWDVYKGKVESGTVAGSPMTYFAYPSDELSLLTYDSFYYAGQPTSGIWVAKESVADATYRDRELKAGEMEVVYGTMPERIPPIEINMIDEVMGTSAEADNVKYVSFKIDTGDGTGEYSDAVGFLFPEETYVTFNEEIITKGNYSGGYHYVLETGNVERAWYGEYLLNAEGMVSLTGWMKSNVYHFQVIVPSTGETVGLFFAADTINENCYTVLEEGIEFLEPEPTATPEPVATPEPTATPEPVATPEATVAPTVAPTSIPQEWENSGDKSNLWSEHPAALPAVAVATVVTAGLLSAIIAGISPSLEAAAGVEKRRGTLHINGDVDVPDIHLENIKDIAIPVHVTEGEGIKWIFMAKTFTPGKKKLVSTYVLPLNAMGAEIKLKLSEDFESKVTGSITMYLEVAALGLDVHGERNLLEKMVEVNIVKDKEEI